MRNYPKFYITAKGEKFIKTGHVWVFGDEVTKVEGTYQNGDIVDVLSPKGKYVGSGFVNDNSKIRVRIISTNTNDKFDEDFWQRRIRYSLNYRRQVMGDDFNCCRLIFGEADGFPGLTVDRFNDVLVAQVLSLGTEQRKDLIFSILLHDLPDIKGIYERNDVKIRELEGMEQGTGWYQIQGVERKAKDVGKRSHGEGLRAKGEGIEEDGLEVSGVRCQVSGVKNGITEIVENGIRYKVDFANGQKTGFFLDQKYNRQAVAKIAKGRKVLDCFTHTGSFALNALQGGAERVTAVDISADALKMAEENAKLNGWQLETVEANVFDLLTKLVEEHNKDYDFIILDPPAFTKSGATVQSAIRGYKEINKKAMKLLPRGGYLATCSCSHFMKEEFFVEMLRQAAKDAAVSLRQVEARQQAPDHPILWNVPETNYLKFYIFQVV